MSEKGFFGNVASGAGNLWRRIKGLFKFFTTFIGHIVFYLIIILLIAFLLYIIASVILKDVAKLIGIEGGAQSSASDYAYLNRLSSSGYDAMLSADELVEYHAFEYAVLMDAARFLEETGTTELHVANGMPNFDLFFSGDPAEDRLQWAILAAAALMSNYPEADDQASYDAMIGEHIPQLLNLEDENNNQDQTGGGNSDEASDPNAEFGEGNFTTKYTKDNLFYRPVYNQYTGERSLVPYLEMTRDYDIVKYYIEFRDGPANTTGESSPYGNGQSPNGGTAHDTAYNMDNIVQNLGVNLVLGRGGEGETNDFLNYFQRQRFTLGDNSKNYYGFEASYKFIYNHLYPLEIVSELNVASQSAYPTWDATYDASGGGQVDLYKEYGPSLHYTVQKAPTNHKIPLRILIDRFLPNAVLMSSWRILKDDAATERDIVDEIQKIYSEACLEGEEFNGQVLLVKDVNNVAYGITANTEAPQLFDKSFSASKVQPRYLDGTYTSTIYNSYAPLVDSRTLAGVEEEEEQTPNNPNAPGEGAEEGGGELAAAPQPFGGTLKDDIMDDIKLVLTHYSKESDKSMTEYAYDKVLEDADRLIEVIEGATSSSGEQYVIYTPREEGGYFTKCDLGDENENHYDNGRHYSRNDPYSASAEIQNCFIPLVKVAYGMEDKSRMTSVIICYEDTYTGYVVKSREMQDEAKMTNKKTFVHFETREDVSATTVRHWQFASPSGQATEEKWLVEDAFEGLSVGLGTFSLNIKFNGGPRGGGIAEIELPADALNLSPEKTEELLKQIKINGQAYDESKIFKKNKMAIVRQFEDDPSRRDYESDPTMLALPTDPSISNEYLAQYIAIFNAGGFGHTGGESIITDKDFINLKKYGLQAGQNPNIDTSGVEELTDYYNLGPAVATRLVYIYLYKKANDRLPVMLSDANDELLLEEALAYLYTQEMEVWPVYRSYTVTMDGCDEEYAVVMPTRRSIIPIKQDFWDKRIRFYLVKDAAMWSGVKKFNSIITYNGEYRNRGNFMYLISKNKYARGLRGYRVNKTVNYRCKLFAPIFAGNDSSNTNARETDVLLILSEWLEASEQGIHAADHFIRDLNALINYSKGIDYEDGSNVLEPIEDENGNPYINAGSYTYMYIPDEILKFDDTTSEKAFWLDRLICTPEDPIDQTKENYLRSKAETFTWQIVDYDLYEECQNGDGTAKVYPLWPFGNQMSRLMYAIGSNASDNEANKIHAWGGYAPGMHSAADLFSRNMAKKIYADIFREDAERGSIRAEYSLGGINMTGTDSTLGGAVDIGEHADSASLGDTEVGGDGIYGFGVYDNDASVSLTLGGQEYRFSGSAAAAYAYELYRYTMILKDGEAAEKLLKERLEKEIEWPEERAVAPGIVTRVEGTEQGFIVEITHGPQTVGDSNNKGVYTSYWHLKRYPLVQIGQYVGAGTLVGYEGTTGQSGTTHIHMDMNVYNESEVNPVLHLYPFFTPFYYEEKAAEDNYLLESDYMSTARTVFPYGQAMNAHVGGLTVNQTEVDENGWVKVQNYVPTKDFMLDSSLLYDEDSGFEGFVDYSKLPTKNVYRDLDKSDYEGEILETNPYYFSEAFIRKVAANGYKIKDVELTWDEITTYDPYQHGVVPEDEPARPSGDNNETDDSNNGPEHNNNNNGQHVIN